MTPTFRFLNSLLFLNRAATATALEGSITIFMRSQTRRMAPMVAWSLAVLVFYSVTGGIVASVYTDVIQGAIMAVAGDVNNDQHTDLICPYVNADGSTVTYVQRVAVYRIALPMITN